MTFQNRQLQHKLDAMRATGRPIIDLGIIPPFSSPDFSSNDYLSICKNPALREDFLSLATKHVLLFGTRSARHIDGNPPEYVALEKRLETFFKAPSTLVFNSGYDANASFFGYLPQPGDVVLFDQLIHASCRDGMSHTQSKIPSYPFAHNSVDSLSLTITRILEKHPKIAAAEATLFIALESLYSMDGDFCPLLELVEEAERLVPAKSLHFFVDEAHSTGVYGSEGRGLVSMYGLEDRIHTVLHTFGKARGLIGAVICSSPQTISWLTNTARPAVFTTAMPHMNLLALNCSFNLIGSPAGDRLRDKLRHISAFYSHALIQALVNVPKSLIRLSEKPAIVHDGVSFVSPIFPLITPHVLQLSRYLQDRGYTAQAIPYPIVPRGLERIRTVVHAETTEEEVRDFVGHVTRWIEEQGRVDSAPYSQVQASSKL